MLNWGGSVAVTTAAPTATVEPDPPTRIVAAFYDAISRKDFTTAWNLLSPTFQKDGSFDKFRNGYATTQSVRVSVSEVPGAPQKVRASLDATDLINGNTVHSQFDGWWVLTQASDGRWLLDNGHFTKTKTDASGQTANGNRNETPTTQESASSESQTQSGTVSALDVPDSVQTEAFNETAASNSLMCAAMQGAVKISNARGPTLNDYPGIAAAAKGCLQNLRSEGDDIAAQYPARFILAESCVVLNHNSMLIRACQGVSDVTQTPEPKRTVGDQEDDEAQSYSNLEAFNTTAASSGLSCQDMIRQSNDLSANPQLRTLPNIYTVLATEASLCLQAVRRETLDLLPTRIPRSTLITACERSRALDPDSFKSFSAYCAASQFKPGTHLYDP